MHSSITLVEKGDTHTVGVLVHVGLIAIVIILVVRVCVLLERVHGCITLVEKGDTHTVGVLAHVGLNAIFIIIVVRVCVSC